MIFDGTGLFGSAVALAGPFAPVAAPALAVGGGALALLAGGAKLYRDAQGEERTKMGADLWRTDFKFVASLASNLPVLEESLRSIVTNPQTDTQLRLSASAALQRFSEWRTQNDLPDSTTSLEKLLLSVPGVSAQVERIRADVAKKHDPSTDRAGYDAGLMSELQNVVQDTKEIKSILQPLAEDLQKRMKAEQDAREEAELERTISDFVGAGQVIGMIVGIKNPRAGAAITGVFEQGAVLYKSVRAIKAAIDAGTAIQMAALASGVGAAFAIAGALSALGGGGAASSTEAILNAIREVLEAISKLSSQIRDLSNQLRDFSIRTELNFTELDEGIEQLTKTVGDLEFTINTIKFEDIRGDVFNAIRDFRASGTREAAHSLLKTAYSIGLSESSRSTQTLEAIAGHKLAAMVWMLSDEATANPLGPGIAGNVRGGPLLLSTALERYPTLLTRTANWYLQSDEGRNAALGDSLSVEAGMTDDLSRKALENRGAIHPTITAMAVDAVAEALRFLLLRPELPAANDAGALLTPLEMAQDVVTVASWPRRVVAAISGSGVAFTARQAHSVNVGQLLQWVTQQRAKTAVLKDVPPKLRLPLLMGATAIYETRRDGLWEVTSPIFNIKLRMAYETGTIAPDGKPQEGAAIRDAEEQDVAWSALQLCAALGHGPELVSLSAWVEFQIAGLPSWLGYGPFHEVFALRITNPSLPGGNSTLFYLHVSDPGVPGVPQNQIQEVERRQPSGDWETAKYVFHAARGRQAELPPQLPFYIQDLTGAPFTDEAYNEIATFMGSVTAFGSAGFSTLFQRLRDANIDFDLYLGDSAYPDVVARSFLVNAITADLGRPGADTSMPLDASLVEKAASSWLTIVAAEIASLERSPANLARVFALVRRCPKCLRENGLINTVFASKETQMEYWFNGLSRLLLRNDPPVEKEHFRIDLVSKEQIKGLEGRAAVTPEMMGSFVHETGELSLATTSGASPGPTDVPPVSALPITNRALASIGQHNQMVLQLTGWPDSPGA